MIAARSLCAAKGKVDSATMAKMRDQDRKLFSDHVVVGWSGIVNSEGDEVEFNKEDCFDFLKALPLWLMDEIRNFAQEPENFLKGNEPSEAEVRAQAGN